MKNYRSIIIIIYFPDFDQLDKEISETRRDLKPKLLQLRDLEHKDNPKGFHLNPLTKEEMRAVEQML